MSPHSEELIGEALSYFRYSSEVDLNFFEAFKTSPNRFGLGARHETTVVLIEKVDMDCCLVEAPSGWIRKFGVHIPRRDGGVEPDLAAHQGPPARGLSNQPQATSSISLSTTQEIWPALKTNRLTIRDVKKIPKPLWRSGSVVCLPFERSPRASKSSARFAPRIVVNAPTPSSSTKCNSTSFKKPLNDDVGASRMVDDVVDHLGECEIQNLCDVFDLEYFGVKVPNDALLVAPDLVLVEIPEPVDVLT